MKIGAWRSATGIITASLFAIVGAQQAPGAPQQPPNPNIAPSAAGTSAISGVAVDGATGQPLEGVVVYLGPPQHGPPGQPIRQLTDAKGRFVFGHLPAFEGYFINASKPGYNEGHYGRGSSGQLGARITVAEGQWARDLKVVMNRLGSISGTLVDDQNEPIVGAYVRVLLQIPIAGNPQLAGGSVARTDDRGEYRISSLAPGKYYVQMPSVQNAFPASTTTATLASTSPQAAASAEAAGRTITFADPVVDVDETTQVVAGRYPIPPRAADGRAMVYPATFYPSAATIAGSVALTLAPGEQRTGVDLRVTPVVAHRVSGRIDGPPESFAGLTLRLMLPGTEDMHDGGEAATALVSTDGRFTFVNVPPGDYVVDARRTTGEYQFSGVIGGAARALPRTPASTSTTSGSYGVFSGPEGVSFAYRVSSPASGFWARQAVNVANQDVSDVVIQMRRGGVIAGRYVYEGARPTLFGLLSAQPAHGTASLGVGRTRDNASGPDTFAIEGLLPGEYILDSTASRVKSITCAGEDYTYRAFDLSTGRDFTDCVVTFTDKTISVTGTVRDTRGQGLGESAVIVFPVEREQWSLLGLSPNRVKSLQVTNAGFYRFQSLPEGDYYFIAVVADQVNAWLDPGFFDAAVPQATRVHLSWGATVTQDLSIKKVAWPR